MAFSKLKSVYTKVVDYECLGSSIIQAQIIPSSVASKSFVFHPKSKVNNEGPTKLLILLFYQLLQLNK